MPYSASALGVLPPLWSSAAKKPWPVLIFSYCVVFTISFSRGAVAVVHLAGGMKRADRQVPDEHSSSFFHHRLGGNVVGELPDREGTGLAQQRDVLRGPAPAWRFRGGSGIYLLGKHMANDGLPGMINGSWETKYHDQKTNIHRSARPGCAKAA